MNIDPYQAKTRLRTLKLISGATWAIAFLLAVVPLYQWFAYGTVTINMTFLVLTALNLILVWISVNLSKRIRFTSYQIKYFSTHGYPGDDRTF